MAPSVARLAKSGVTLAAEELAAVGRAILSAAELRRYVTRSASALSGEGRRAGSRGGSGRAGGRARPPLRRSRRWPAEIPELDDLARMIFRIVDREGQVKEKEIPELRSIAARIQGLRGDVARLASSWIGDPEREPWWQSDRPTTRDGRLVLAIKANFRSRVAGIVHESSASGATVYVEPADIAEKNNEIALQRGEYDRELARILREASAKLAVREADLRTARAPGVGAGRPAGEGALRRRARVLARRSPPTGSSRWWRRGTRCSARRAIPIEVRLAGDVRTLIITGPNTGGKTVSLKTVGLLAVMNQFGMEIPAAPGSRLPVFDNVLADIGDEQSIEQSLSTFSGHVRNLVAHRRARRLARSLVLLDELGAGTDPEEGVAIAMAVLDHFIETRAVTLVTTHHGILKNYGYTRAGRDERLDGVRHRERSRRPSPSASASRARATPSRSRAARGCPPAWSSGRGRT